MSWVAVGVGGASLLGGILGGGASAAASRAQVEYEEQALAQEKAMFNQEQANEQPYIQGGSQAEAQLNYLLGEGTPGSAGQGLGGGGGGGTAYSSPAGGYGSLLQPFTTQDFQSLSPAYQFQLQQGGQGTLNQASSAQGAESGSALSALQSYNQQFANTSFNNAFNQYQTQQNNVFGRLSQLATLGSNAGSNSSTGASAFSGQQANTLGSIGASTASGITGATSQVTGGLTSGIGPLLSGLNNIGSAGSTVGYTPYYEAGGQGT